MLLGRHRHNVHRAEFTAELAVVEHHAAVTRARPMVQAAKGTGEGSERWLGAQVALAELDVARTAIDVPLGDLERLAIDRAAAGAPPYPALDAAVAQANAAAAAQRTAIATLNATLR